MTPSGGPVRRAVRVARAALLILGLLAAVAGVAGCGSTQVTAPPADSAARLVPADTLAYLSVSLDRHRQAVGEAGATLTSLKGYSGFIAGLKARLAAISGVAYGSGIAPWLGDEVAVAFVPAGRSASELIVLSVSDRAAARRFVARVHGASARLIDGNVLLGEAGVVAAAGHGAGLSGVRGYRSAMASAPADRVLSAYGTGRGLEELLGGRSGLAGVAEGVLSAEEPADVSAALAPTSDGLRLWVRLTGVGQTPAGFRPTLAAQLPARTTWMVDMPSLTASGPGLLGLYAAASHTSGVTSLADRLGSALRAEGVSPGPLEALFSHETALFQLNGHLGLITHVADVRSARLELGSAGGALAGLFASAGGSDEEPLVSTVTVDGVPVTEYQTGDSQLDYAVVRGNVVIATAQSAVQAIIDRKDPLSGSSLYGSVLAGSGSSAGPVLYGAMNRLVRRGGDTGILEQIGLSDAAPALARISAAGLASVGGQSQTTAELYFTIS